MMDEFVFAAENQSEALHFHSGGATSKEWDRRYVTRRVRRWVWRRLHDSIEHCLRPHLPTSLDPPETIYTDCLSSYTH